MENRTRFDPTPKTKFLYFDLKESFDMQNIKALAVILFITSVLIFSRCSGGALAPSDVDLIGTAVSGPASANPVDTITVSNTVENRGADNAGAFRVGIFLSDDAVITTDDILLQTRDIGSLAGGTNDVDATSVTIPAGISAGDHYLGIIVDNLFSELETDESNNALASISPISIVLPAQLVAVAGDAHLPLLNDFLIRRGLSVHNFIGALFSTYPDVDGDIVVWQDNRSGNLDIYAYNLRTSTEFKVNQDAGTAEQTEPDIDGNLIVWVDKRNTYADIYAYDLGTNTEFKVNQDTGSPSQYNPAVSGDIVVWYDSRNPSFDIYAYDLGTSTEFKVNQDAGAATQSWPDVSGDIIVWNDNRNGNYDIYAYDLGTSTEFKVNQDAGMDHQWNPVVSGNLIVWRDDRDFLDIYGYDLSTSTEFKVNQSAGNTLKYHPAVSGDIVVWEDNRTSGGQPSEIFMRDVTAGEEIDISSTKKMTLKSLEANINDYAMILFGDDLFANMTLDLFDTADAAGVPMLGAGAEGFESKTLGEILADDGRFALSTGADSDWDGMHIDVTSDGQGHPIFNGIDTAATLILEDDPGALGDERFYDVNAIDPDAPADWAVLANLGPSMFHSGESAIVEFTTPNGTRVMLDGSANTYDGYEFWTQTRWDILYNQVLYLMGQ